MMSNKEQAAAITERYITPDNHAVSDYFATLSELIQHRKTARNEDDKAFWQAEVNAVYTLLEDELLTNTALPVSEVKFGTSGWRGILGKDIFLTSVATVTCAILNLYKEGKENPHIFNALGNIDFATMQQRGCVLGFDNRFGGNLLALAVANVLTANKVKVFYAGESTTGALSASVLQHQAAFSINLTPSHNPMQYGGFKFNAADAGPAAAILTDTITTTARQYLAAGTNPYLPATIDLQTPLAELTGIETEDALRSWQQLVRQNENQHGIAYSRLLADFAARENVVVCVDAVHGASRDYISRLLGDPPPERLVLLRNTPDPTFDGIAPEPSSANMQPVLAALNAQQAPLKIGAIIDPDGDRIRFTDGDVEISMNQFGAMAYHFIHEVKHKKGMVAKTVATSNLANGIATQLGEEIFEPRVGFKEFKPVMGKALVFFEESDGISIIGHTPEKDAFIGLILAIDMVLTLGISLGQYLRRIEDTFGYYYPDRDGIVVGQSGQQLLDTLQQLEKYQRNENIMIGGHPKRIEQVIDIDGRKMILEDGSWIMIRPSGTEPKVRFYVEARDAQETALLTKSAHSMLAEIGLLP
ncbi:phosphoglucomutase [Desulfogranum marinum]|uniref:phosphoglucomutase n=1 Tax=Desulfogranum marinum TaxID=453220 RepID=UPI0029C8AF9C|nr:phosphoglucomutase [Desulfogranum marinum]